MGTEDIIATADGDLWHAGCYSDDIRCPTGPITWRGSLPAPTTHVHSSNSRHRVLAVGLHGDSLQALIAELAARHAPVTLIVVSSTRGNKLDTDPASPLSLRPPPNGEAAPSLKPLP